MMKTKLLSLAVALLIAGAGATMAKKVHTIGDSTMANYDESATVTRGWAMYLQQFLDGIEVNNRGKGGASSKSFYREAAYWQSVKQQMQEGDYVLIQFAHNDEKNGGADGDSIIAYYNKVGDTTAASSADYRGTTPTDTYRKYLRLYVEETRAKGCTPVLVTPICRMYFSNGDIRRNGRHDLGDSYTLLTANGVTTGNKVGTDDHTMDYVYQMKQVAEEMGVTLIDLTAATRSLFTSYGDTKCHELLSDGDGSTHLSTMGATLIARLCAQEMKEKGVLADNINVSADLSVSPASADLGEAYVGQVLTKEFSVSGFSLSPESGTVSITAGDGIEVSADKTAWDTTAELSYTGGTLIGKFYARVQLTAAGTVDSHVTIAAGDYTVAVPIKAVGMSMESGTTVKAYWRLESDDSYTLEGPAQPIAESWSNMYVQRYSNPNKNTVWPEGTGFEATRKTQRNLIVGDAWPADEIDEVSNRYIQFAITPSKGTTLKIDSIGMYVCGCGGNGMRCHINYSTEPDFANQHTIFAPSSMPANNMLAVEALTTISLEEGDTLRLRVYPWYNGAATGKTICLSDVMFSGRAIESGGTPIDAKDATVTWTFDKGTDSPTAAETTAPEAVSASSYSLGSNLTIVGTGSGADEVMSKLQPVTAVAKAQDASTFVKFAFTPKKGVYFAPKSLSFNAARFGTNGGAIDVYAVRGQEKVTLTEGLNPNRPNDKNDETPEYSAETYAINDMAASPAPVEIWFYIYNLAANKQVGLSDVTITGDFSGTAITVPVHTMSVKMGMEGAGEVACNPSGSEFDEGTSLTVTATENFGYHFAAWVDDAGNTVSTENPYTFTISENTSLTATYTKNNVYALNINIDGGANANLVQVSPEGNIVDGVRHYEEGTDVQLSAQNNRILTFTGWEDNTTEAQRGIRIDSDKEVTAHFSACDYIVGWDFYNDQPASERAADYKADSENAGLLSLRNEAGNTSSWLALGSAKGGQNGKYGARVWKDLSDKWYFEISCSSKGYSNLKLAAAVGDDYNTYSIINAEYSVDGTTYTAFGTFNPPSRGWDSQEFALPAEANGQDKVYIRFMPDYTSPMVGVTSTYDGTSVAEIFVLADKDVEDDATAPQLVSSIPADKSTGASATGSIVLTFDERIVAGQGDATLNGETLQPTISGKNAVYKYQGLAYGTNHTFTLPAGAITDRSGNAYEGVTITFTTMERKQPEAHTYDAVVAQDGTGDYTTVQAAIDAAPTNRVKPWLIFIKNGEYKEHIDIPKTKPYLHFTGQNRDSVILTDNQLCGGDNAVHVSVGATVVVNSNDCYFDNLTLENSFGHDNQSGPQALALNTIGDRTVFKNVAMLSYQDTWITPSTSNYRVYVKNSFIEGAVDFIYNSGNVFIDNTTLYINRKSGGYIVAPSHASDVEWGYVFMNCTITAPGVPSETDVWLGRPWHNNPKTVYINTRAEVTIPAAGWYETMGGLPVLWADYNTVDGNGNPVDLSHRRDTYYYTDSNGEKVYGKAKNYLTPEEAAQYTVKNVLSGDDDWQPEIITESCNAPVPVISDDKITWAAVPYAICYIITKNGKVEGFTTACECSYEAGAEYLIQAVNEQGGPSEVAKPTESDGISNATAPEANGIATTYSVAGYAIDQPANGICIVKHTDGSVSKQIKR